MRWLLLIIFLIAPKNITVADQHYSQKQTTSVHAHLFAQRSALILNPLSSFALRGILKLCMLNSGDIAKIIFRLAAFWYAPGIPDCVIDYGCEAGHAACAYGLRAIPARLISYALADICYAKISAGMQRVGLRYPDWVKAHWYTSYGAHILEPIVGKRIITHVMQQLLERYFCAQENDDQILSDMLV